MSSVVHWKLFAVLWIASVVVNAAILPYILTLRVFNAAQLSAPLSSVIGLQMAQSGMAFGVVIFAGLFLGRHVGLGVPFLDEWLRGRALAGLRAMLQLSVSLGRAGWADHPRPGPHCLRLAAGCHARRAGRSASLDPAPGELLRRDIRGDRTAVGADDAAGMDRLEDQGSPRRKADRRRRLGGHCSCQHHLRPGQPAYDSSASAANAFAGSPGRGAQRRCRHVLWVALLTARVGGGDVGALLDRCGCPRPAARRLLSFPKRRASDPCLVEEASPAV